jgi:hypothetical protein
MVTTLASEAFLSFCSASQRRLAIAAASRLRHSSRGCLCSSRFVISAWS